MGYIYLYTGTGEGKTTNALGLALRSVGHKKRVVVIQFLKWWKKTGEYKIKDKLEPYYEIYQFGRAVWLGEEEKRVTYGGQTFRVEKFKDVDKELMKKALEFAKTVLKEKKPDLLILDEINLALHWKLLDVKDVLNFLDAIPEKTDIVLTGRYAPNELIEKADFVSVIEQLKAPKEFKAKKGMQY
ncbi:MAG: cob(I)yrinic acid a,c-diamide adenosyltransferase [Candidatus Bathyarchaeia archaeon]